MKDYARGRMMQFVEKPFLSLKDRQPIGAL
jgi:hypothetical protein